VLCLLAVAVAVPLLSWTHGVKSGPPVAMAAPLPPPPPACTGPLTGRTLTISSDVAGFGAVQGQPPLPLNAGEYVLSIDDGPNPATTLKLLDIFDRACVHASFFMIGRHAEANPTLARRVVQSGGSVGSHSYSHGNIGLLPPREREAEITDGVDAVEKAAYGAARPSDAPRLFRLPGGPGLPPTPPADWMAFLKARHLVLAGYDLSPQDWRNSPPQESFARLFLNIPDRGVIVMHDGQSNTPALLQMVLAELEKRHARVVTLRLAGDH
jgi:peptidoglycan/xylan/chitin deacetylase (PgdA/CDA1 family)